jgi:hypothetical protein
MSTPESLQTTLTIIRNSSADIQVFLTGDDDEFVNLTGFVAGKFRMIDMIGSAGEELLVRDSVTINPGGSVTISGVTAAEWKLLGSGLFIADLALQDGSDDWFYSEIFYVEITDSITDVSAPTGGGA